MRSWTVSCLIMMAVSCAVPLAPSSAQAPAPVMEFSSVLTSLDVFHHDGRLALEDDNAALSVVFLPAGATFDVAISSAGSNRPLHVQPMTVTGGNKVFQRVEARGRSREFKFTKPGKYVATYRVNGKPITVVPFSIQFAQNDDQFDPKTHVYANGPWSDWAYLFASVEAGADAQPEIRFWVRKKSFVSNPPADRYTVELRKDGDVVAVSNGSSSNAKRWQFLREPLFHPQSKGGRAIKLKELVDGQYAVTIKRGPNPHATFKLSFRDGKPVPHPRQAANHQPRTEYLVPRFPGLLGTLGSGSSGHAIWMKRLSDAEAQAMADGATARPATVSEEDKKRWHWLPRRIDPNRPFKVAITEIATRSDTGIAVGEDLIVFGTGFPTGVKYMKVGDTEPREIPGGETYNSKVFGVCGTKIVLVKKNQVLVYDTESENLSELPPAEITLYNPGKKTLVTDGFLVGTVNRATAVTDRTIVKVIDVSRDRPSVIPIKNADYVDSDVTSLAIDAKHGVLAVSSRRKKLLTAAKVAPLANQHSFDVTDYRGVGSQQIEIEDDWIVYADEDQKVRLLDLSDGMPKAITDEAFASTGNGFYVRKGRLAVATTAEKTGSRYRFAISDLDDSPVMVPGTGTAIPGTSGGLGMAGSAAIAIDKTVFIAGNPGDSIGVGEHLQMLSDDDQSWIPLKDDAGKVISASDVQTSIGCLTFKARNQAGRTVIGYATYGQRITGVPQSPAVAAKQEPAPGSSKSSSPSPKQVSTGPITPIEFEKENIFYTKDEAEEAMLATMLELEANMLPAFTQAFGAATAKQRVIEQVTNSLKGGDNEHLIDEWKRRCKSVAPADKPKPVAEVATSGADPRAVEAALSGQWEAVRFVIKGEELPDEQTETIRLTFAAGKYVMAMGGQIDTGNFKIDSSVKPYRLSLEATAGPNQGNTFRAAIKLLEDDYLLIVRSDTPTGPQPTKFLSSPTSQTSLSAFQKIK